jgi:HEPN domain-containing protein
LQRLAELRLSDAEALFAARGFEGSYYLAGYAVECALKACIAKRTREFDFPDRRLVERSYTHDLARLLEVAELEDDLAQGIAADGELKGQWNTAIAWSERSRYLLEVGEEAAQYMLIAVRGVLSWLKTRW